jgi:hypothetical protein
VSMGLCMCTLSFLGSGQVNKFQNNKCTCDNIRTIGCIISLWSMTYQRKVDDSCSSSSRKNDYIRMEILFVLYLEIVVAYILHCSDDFHSFGYNSGTVTM